MASANTILADDWVRHAVLLEQFKTGEIKRLISWMNKSVLPDIVAKADRIGQRYDRAKASRLGKARGRRALNRQLREMTKLVRGAEQLMHARLTGTMTTLAKSEAAWAAQALQRVLPLRTDYTMPSPQLLRSIVTSRPMQGKMLRDWSKSVGTNTARNVNQAIMLGVAQGEGVETIVRRIRGTAAANFKDGVLQATRNEAAMVTRTAVNHVGQHAREAVFRENPDVVQQVEWLATLDSRTSVTCASLDGRVYDIDKGPRPPAHPNCRSVMIPVVKPPTGIPGIDTSKLPAGERAALGGPVSGKVSFGPWLKRQPAAVQDQVLGSRGKGRLFRRGRVPIEKFSDVKTLRPLSLARLQALEAKALQAPRTVQASTGEPLRNLVTLPNGPADVLEAVQAWMREQSQPTNTRFKMQQLRDRILKVTGKAPSQQYLPRMVRKLIDEGLIEKQGGQFVLTPDGLNVKVRRVKGGTVAPKPKPKPVDPEAARKQFVEGLRKDLDADQAAFAKPRNTQTGSDLRDLMLRPTETPDELLEAQDIASAAFRKADNEWNAANDRLRAFKREHGLQFGDAPKTDDLMAQLFKLQEADAAAHSARITARQRLNKAVKDINEHSAKVRRDLVRGGGNLNLSVSYPEGAMAVDGGKHWSDASGKWVKNVKVKSAVKKKTDEITDWLNDVVRVPDKQPDFAVGNKPRNKAGDAHGVNLKINVHGLREGGRAFSSRGRGIWVQAEAETAQVIAHEIAHQLEDGMFGRTARRYRRFRARQRYKDADGNQGYKLQERESVSPGHPKEVGYADKFEYAYTGRWYGDESATEILSMYVEQLYARPVAFAKNDPEGFAFIVDTLRGVPLEQQSWFVNANDKLKAFILEQQ